MITDTLTSMRSDAGRLMILLQTLGTTLLEHDMMVADDSGTKVAISEWFGALLRTEAYSNSDELK